LTEKREVKEAHRMLAGAGWITRLRHP
jgi:hypothetical protein